MNYRELFEQVKSQIEAKRAEQGAFLKRAEELEDEIAGLQQSAAGFAKTLREEYIPEDSIGLTDAIRQVFRQNPNRNFTAVELRDELNNMGRDLSKYGNVMASIHSVIKRIDGKDVKVIGNRDSKPAYQWIQKPPVISAAPPPAQTVR